MENMTTDAFPGQRPPGADLGLLRALSALAARKRLLLALPLACAALTLALCLALPNVYRSATQLLPPQAPQSGAAAMLAQLGGAAAAVTGAATVKSPNDVYLAMLGSRRVADRLLARFSLRTVYGDLSPEEARRELARHTSIRAGKDGLITVEVEDGDPKRAAALANAYVEELLALTRVLAVTEASQRRLFFERQLAQTKDALAKAEVALKGALDTGGVISVDSDSRAMIETVGRVRAQISAREVQLASMRAVVTPNNPQFQRAEQELASLKDELARLQNGPETAPGTAPASGKRGLEAIKLLRDVKYEQMLYELLAKQFEAARLDEAKDGAVLQVLDTAIEPERRARPRVLLMTVLGAGFGLLLAVALALALDYKQRLLLTPAGAAAWEELRARTRLGLRRGVS